MGDTHVGLQARLMSQALRKLSGLFLNLILQLYLLTKFVKRSVMFGNPETTPW